MSVALLVLRRLLSVVFCVAAAAKLADLSGSRKSLEQFGAPAWLSTPLSLALPAVELATAILLLPLSRLGGCLRRSRAASDVCSSNQHQLGFARVAHEIRDAIFRGDLPPGSAIKQGRISNESTVPIQVEGVSSPSSEQSFAAISAGSTSCTTARTC